MDRPETGRSITPYGEPGSRLTATPLPPTAARAAPHNELRPYGVPQPVGASYPASPVQR